MVKFFNAHGASVVLGDVDAERGAALAGSFPAKVHFLHTDVTSYESLLGLFDKAIKEYDRIDIAISCAGITEKAGWFMPALCNMETVRQAPPLATLDVNLKGTLYFARIATAYLRHNAAPQDDKSLVLLSSLAGFESMPGFSLYQTSKHGVLGLMRSLRTYLPAMKAGIRVNCVCPGATDTVMMARLKIHYENAGLALQTPDAVARVIGGLAADRAWNGESIYVEGGEGWAIEENLDRTQEQWLGQVGTKEVRKIRAAAGALAAKIRGPKV